MAKSPKKINKKLLIESIIIIIIVTVVLAFKLYTYYVLERVYFIGSWVDIRIEQYQEGYDYLTLESQHKDGHFRPWIPSEYDKLVKYMRENDLVIKPGMYRFYSTDKFVKVKRILNFEKKKHN